jgi:transposase-like protein
VDETYVKLAGRWSYLYRAIDQYAQVIDVLVSARRDAAGARAFLTRALTQGAAPVEVTTDRRRSIRGSSTNSRRPRGMSDAYDHGQEARHRPHR